MFVVDGANHMQAAINAEALAKAYEFLASELTLDDSPSATPAGSAAP